MGAVEASKLLRWNYCVVGHFCHINQRHQRLRVDRNFVTVIYDLHHPFSVGHSSAGKIIWRKISRVSFDAFHKKDFFLYIMKNLISVPVTPTIENTSNQYHLLYPYHRQSTKKYRAAWNLSFVANSPSTTPSENHVTKPKKANFRSRSPWHTRTRNTHSN